MPPSRASLTRTFSPAGGGSYYPSNDGSGNTHGTPSTWTPVDGGVGVVFAGLPRACPSPPLPGVLGVGALCAGVRGSQPSPH